MDIDNETWLLDVGDEIIQRKAENDYSSLSSIEQAIYCFWVIDYCVRNAGDLEQVNELHPGAMEELKKFAFSNQSASLQQLFHSDNNHEEFCEKYYEYFESVCEELRSFYGAT